MLDTRRSKIYFKDINNRHYNDNIFIHTCYICIKQYIAIKNNNKSLILHNSLIEAILLACSLDRF